MLSVVGVRNGAEEDGRRARRRGRAPPPHAAASVAVVVGCSATALLLLRFAVLVSEAHAMVVGERASDDELIDLCRSGAARQSSHMRSACMQATVDRASPAVVRALTRGAYAFVHEVYALVCEPFRAMSLVGVVGALSVVPWIGSLRGMLGMAEASYSSSTRDGGTTDPTVVILHNGRAPIGPAETTDDLLLLDRALPRRRHLPWKGAESDVASDSHVCDISGREGGFV